MDKALAKLKEDVEFEFGGNKEYEVEVIINSAVYGQQVNSYQILDFYYLVSWKGYPKEENIWEPSSVVIHLQKLINTFHKEHPEKLIATSLPLDSAPLMARLMVLKKPKQKYGHPSKGANKRGRK